MDLRYMQLKNGAPRIIILYANSIELASRQYMYSIYSCALMTYGSIITLKCSINKACLISLQNWHIVL